MPVVANADRESIKQTGLSICIQNSTFPGDWVFELLEDSLDKEIPLEEFEMSDKKTGLIKGSFPEEPNVHLTRISFSRKTVVLV